MAYDRQMVAVMFSTGQSNVDTLKQGGKALAVKSRTYALTSSTYEEIDVADAPSSRAKGKFAELTKDSRLYLVGHHDAESGLFAGSMTSQNLAAYLVNLCGLKAVKKIGLVGCRAGADNSNGQTTKGVYAELFHYYLAVPWELLTMVAAYTLNTKVVDDGDMKLVKQLSQVTKSSISPSFELGRKIVMPKDFNSLDAVLPATIAKREYFWDETEQMVQSYCLR